MAIDLVSGVGEIAIPQGYRGVRELPGSAGVIQESPERLDLASGRLAVAPVPAVATARLLATQHEDFRAPALFTGIERTLRHLYAVEADPIASWRQRELVWRQANETMLQERFHGNWIALEGESVIAFGPSAAEVARAARAQGVVCPYVFLVTAAPGGDIGFFGV